MDLLEKSTGRVNPIGRVDNRGIARSATFEDTVSGILRQRLFKMSR